MYLSDILAERQGQLSAQQKAKLAEEAQQAEFHAELMSRLEVNMI